MAHHIILTEEQAKAVYGAASPGYELRPVPLKDGTYMLPTSALTDAKHSGKKAVLEVGTVRDVLVSEMYTEDDDEPTLLALKAARDRVKAPKIIATPEK